MKKLLSLILVAGSAAALSACGAIPPCHDELDECTYGGAYTEERTIQTKQRRVVAAPKPAPAPVVAPKPAPAPVKQVAPKPAPAPAPVVVTTPAPIPAPVIYDATPDFTQITK